MNHLNTVLSPKWFFQLLDALGILVSFATAYLSVSFWGPWFNPDFQPLEESATGLLILALPLWLLLLDWSGMYVDPVHVSYAHIGIGMGRVLLISLGVVSLVVFGIKEQGVSRLFVFSYGAATFVVLTALRFAEKAYYGTRYRAGYYARRPLVIGSPESIQALSELAHTSGSGPTFQINSWPIEKRESPWSSDDLRSFSTQLRERLARQAIGELILVLREDTVMLRHAVQSICAELRQPLWVVPETVLQLKAATPDWNTHADYLLGVPALVFLQTERKPVYEFVKRLLDLTFSVLLIVLLFPLFIVIGLAVKLTSPGPVFYRWRVLGQNNREFTGYKFRTMVHNADQLKPDLLRYNEMTGPVFKMKHDPRVTPVGRFLRRYSLDELPQLFSVVKGDMSLVGPRPPLKSEFERFEFWHARKLSVKPGMTCLWQVGGRNDIKDFDEWVRLDLEYIDGRSLRTDFEIMARTALAVLKGTGQ